MSRISRALLFLVMASGAGALFSGCMDSAPPTKTGPVTLKTLSGVHQGYIPMNAEWAAFQDGDAAWAPVNPVEAGVYQGEVTDHSGRYGFAFYYNGKLFVHHSTVRESPVLVGYLDFGRGGVPNGLIPVSGSISYDFPPGKTNVSLSTQSRWDIPITSYDIQTAPGLNDFAVWDQAQELPYMPSWIYYERNVDVQGASMTHNLNVTASNIIPLLQDGTLTVTGDLPPQTLVAMNYVTANGTNSQMAAYGWTPPANGIVNFARMPRNAMLPGDKYSLFIMPPWGCKVVKMTEPHNQRISMPTTRFDTMQCSFVSMDPSPYWSLRFGGLTVPDSTGYLLVGTTTNHIVELLASSGWLSRGGLTAYQVPDFNGVGNWQTDWNISSDETLTNVAGNVYGGTISIQRAIAEGMTNRELMGGTEDYWYSATYGTRN